MHRTARCYNAHVDDDGGSRPEYPYGRILLLATLTPMGKVEDVRLRFDSSLPPLFRRCFDVTMREANFEFGLEQPGEVLLRAVIDSPPMPSRKPVPPKGRGTPAGGPL